MKPNEQAVQVTSGCIKSTRLYAQEQDDSAAKAAKTVRLASAICLPVQSMS